MKKETGITIIHFVALTSLRMTERNSDEQISFGI